MIFRLLAIGFLLSGCMTERLPLPAEHPGIPDQSVFLVKKIGYDGYGRPLFTERLDGRPRSAGDTFTVVHAINGFPSRSYDIAIMDQPSIGPGPLAVIYEWTGRGYEGGVEITGGLLRGGVSVGSGKEAVAYLAVVAAPVVIATATGFVVGVLACIPEVAKELKDVIVSTGEAMTGYRDYTYDDQGRIRFMRLYPPEEHGDLLVLTEFFYEGPGREPARTMVTSSAEKKVRQLP